MKFVDSLCKARCIGPFIIMANKSNTHFNKYNKLCPRCYMVFFFQITNCCRIFYLSYRVASAIALSIALLNSILVWVLQFNLNEIQMLLQFDICPSHRLWSYLRILKAKILEFTCVFKCLHRSDCPYENSREDYIVCIPWARKRKCLGKGNLQLHFNVFILYNAVPF